jgi:hypothetical protein
LGDVVEDFLFGGFEVFVYLMGIVSVGDSMKGSMRLN